MADEVAASASKAVRKATVKAFMSPSFNIVKVIPQGIVEIVLRGAAVVSRDFSEYTRSFEDISVHSSIDLYNLTKYISAQQNCFASAAVIHYTVYQTVA